MFLSILIAFIYIYLIHPLLHHEILLSTMHCLLMKHLYFFFFNDTATTEIYTLSLHDALPIRRPLTSITVGSGDSSRETSLYGFRSEEHTSELQSRFDIVCRLLLEKKNHSTTCGIEFAESTCRLHGCRGGVRP